MKRTLGSLPPVPFGLLVIMDDYVHVGNEGGQHVTNEEGEACTKLAKHQGRRKGSVLRPVVAVPGWVCKYVRN